MELRRLFAVDAVMVACGLLVLFASVVAWGAGVAVGAVCWMFAGMVRMELR